MRTRTAPRPSSHSSRAKMCVCFCAHVVCTGILSWRLTVVVVVVQGASVGPQLELPLGSNVRQMEELVNELLQVRWCFGDVIGASAARKRIPPLLTLAAPGFVVNAEQNGKKKVPYSLFLGDTEITTSLKATVEELVRWRTQSIGLPTIRTGSNSCYAL